MPITQDELAASAQRLGFAWSRSTVAAIEGGTRELSVAELLALPFILAEAGAQHPGVVAAGFTLFELVRPGPKDLLTLSDKLALSDQQARKYIGEGGPAYRVKADGGVVTEAETKAAERLGVDVAELQAASYALWDGSLPHEREVRVSHRKPARTTPRTLQALRGHVTRELLNELAEHFGVEL